MIKPNFVLDLDQTIISAEPTEDFTKNTQKMKKFVFHNMDDYYIVFERPNLQEFLTFLFDNFTVSVWTAATKDYALFIIDKIILAGNSNRKLDYVFFSYHCGISEDKKSATKALSLFWDVYKLPNYSRTNTIILDDYDEVCKSQPKNCITAKPFEYNEDDSENDTFLKELTPKLKDLLNVFHKTEDIARNIKLINKKS